MFGNNPFADYKKYIEEKAESKAQQRLMGQALAYKRGEIDDPHPEAKKVADSMTLKQLEDFAKTKHKGLPDKVGEDASADDEEEFHQKLDKLVHDTFGKSDTEKEQEEGLAQARKNVGADSCWDGYKADGTKKKNGKEVPNCVKEAKEVHIRLDHLDGDKRQKQITALLQKFEDEGTIEFSGETDKGVLFNLNKPANLRSMNTQLQKVFKGAMFEENEVEESKLTIKKLDKDTMDMLRSLDDEEARLIIQGLPSSLRRKAMQELGLKEKVDGRTKAYKETANRLIKMKEEVFEEVELEEEIELTERKAFIFAAAKAKANGKKTFEFNGKEYKVTMKKGPVVEADPVEEEVEEEVVKEGAVASATVRKEIEKNGGTKIKQDAKSITFTMKGKQHSVPLYKNFVADKDYMELQDLLNEAGYLDAKGKDYEELAKDVDNKKSRDLQAVKEGEVPPQFKKEEEPAQPDDGISDDERKFLKKYGLKRSELKIYRKVEALKKLKD